MIKASLRKLDELIADIIRTNAEMNHAYRNSNFSAALSAAIRLDVLVRWTAEQTPSSIYELEKHYYRELNLYDESEHHEHSTGETAISCPMVSGSG